MDNKVKNALEQVVRMQVHWIEWTKKFDQRFDELPKALVGLIDRDHELRDRDYFDRMRDNMAFNLFQKAMVGVIENGMNGMNIIPEDIERISKMTWNVTDEFMKGLAERRIEKTKRKLVEAQETVKRIETNSKGESEISCEICGGMKELDADVCPHCGAAYE